MSGNPRAEPRQVAIEQLEQFGLSVYAARTFVALATLGSGTAKEVSNVADVPRTRVYDAVEELESTGLVEEDGGSPKQFWAISAATTGQKFQREMDHRVAMLQTAVGELEPVPGRDDQLHVQTAIGTQEIADRLCSFVEAAEKEIRYLTADEQLTDEVAAALTTSSDRGVSVTVAGLTPAEREQLHSQAPGIELVETVWEDSAVGRVLLVDGERALITVRGTDTDRQPDSAIWGTGTANTLVVLLQAVFPLEI